MGRGAAEKDGVQRVQRGEPCCKKLQQLLEVERARSKEEAKGVKGEVSGGGKGFEVYDVASKRSLDENRDGKD